MKKNPKTVEIYEAEGFNDIYLVAHGWKGYLPSVDVLHSIKEARDEIMAIMEKERDTHVICKPELLKKLGLWRVRE